MALSREELDAAPSLVGKFHDKNVKLTLDEREVLAHQGLLNEDGTLKDEALVPKNPLENLPAGVQAPVRLEDLEPDAAAAIESEVGEVRGEISEEAKVDKDKQVSAPLEAPDFGQGGPGVDADDSGFDPGSVDVPAVLANSPDPVLCTHCGFDVREQFNDPPCAESDKQAFLRHILSSGGRFQKSYELFGGDVVLTLRSRTQKEVEMILTQARLDAKAMDMSVGDYTAQINRYLVAASVDKIEDKENEIASFTCLEQLDDENPVVTATDKVYGEGRPTAVVAAITTAWMEFDRLYNWLSSKAHSPDFWKAAPGVPS